MEYVSGIATRTHQTLLEAQVAPLSYCRYPQAFSRHQNAFAVRSNGGRAVAHRMGLSESVLVFEQRLATAKKSDPERKIAVEVSDTGEGLAYAAAGANSTQCEKFPLESVVEFVAAVKREFPHLIISAASGVNASDARAYARAGADFLVTT